MRLPLSLVNHNFIPTHTDSASYNGSATFELSSLGDGVRTSDLEDLKSNAIKCLTDGFFKKLLDLEEV